MPILESFSDNAVFYEDGALEMKNASFKDCVSGESLGTNMVVTSGTMYLDKLNAE